MLPAILGLGQIFSWGTLFYSFPLIVISMEQELGWSKAELYAGATFGLLATAVLSYPVGVGIDRGWGKWIMAGGSFIAMALLAWWSITDSLMSFYIICILIGAIQAGILYEPAFAVLARRVGAANARQGITQITLWAGFASTVFIPITGMLIAALGWRDTLLVLGLFNVMYGLIYLVTLDPSKDHEHASDPQTQQHQKARDRKIVHDNLRAPLLWILLIALTAYAGAFSAFTFHMYPLLQEKGLSDTDVILAIAVIGPLQVLGRIVVTLCARDMPLRLLGSVLVGLLPIIFALLYPAQLSFWFIVVIFSAYGLVNGVFTIVRSFVVPEMLSPHAYGALNGIITLAATLARAITPLAAAWLWESHQSYQPVVLAIVAMSLASMIAFWLSAWWSRPRNNASGTPL